MAQKLFSKLIDILPLVSASRSKIERFSLTAPNRYKVYSIPKRTSGRRIIAHPSKELKIYQRALLSSLEYLLDSHDSAYAYKKDRNIKANAKRHVRKKYLLKMDFNDFFNSITPDMLFTQFVKEEVIFSEAEKRLLKNLLFWNKTKSFDGKMVLSVGAPSSPSVSNFIMKEFDEFVYRYSKEKSIIYTRYADDLTFSTNKKDTLFDMPNFIKKVLGEVFEHKLTINESKTIYTSMAHNRHVTGVTLTNKSTLSIGREKKRLISLLVHKYKINEIDESDFNYLHGLLSFSHHIEPSFTKRLSKKYGSDILKNIIKGIYCE
ncbi:retron St85 family RNA-directed DNA polymerase [Pseudoalteromonas arctica]|uniref:RNA-directed DNA polymerase n=1 Tax=Pseudoalteromonas arctica A 37-1-2 TaxID=1117313 RepID=A0A290S6E1_9GAMM|nr:retron St85 family RNA-directed DNA polymerase [Pseudoalteromonas arctica]ATC87718.1 RNA-directed DNA polymerase [Pseudoalteromonas arctica A 37-1-2]